MIHRTHKGPLFSFGDMHRLKEVEPELLDGAWHTLCPYCKEDVGDDSPGRCHCWNCHREFLVVDLPQIEPDAEDLR